MKNTIYMIVFCLFFTFLLPVQTSHAVGKTVIGVSTVYKETTGSTKFSIFIKSSEPVAAGEFEMVYDSTKLSISKNNVKIGDVFTTQITSINGASAGSVSVAWATDQGVQMDGELLAITGSVRSRGDNIPLRLKNVALYNSSGNKISTQVVHGAIKPFDGEQTVYSENVPVTKEWVVSLNVAMNDFTLNEHSVTVKRGSTIVPIVIEPISSTRFRVKPETKYNTGKHTLEITELVTSLNGTKLKEPVRLEFTVR